MNKPTQTAYWQKPDGTLASYEIEFTPTDKGRAGYAAYQAALATAMQITATLQAEGYKLRFK